MLRNIVFKFVLQQYCVFTDFNDFAQSFPSKVNGSYHRFVFSQKQNYHKIIVL